MIALGIVGILLAVFVGVSIQAGTYFLFRMLTGGLGKLPSMFLSAFLALATLEGVAYLSTANSLQPGRNGSALDERLGQGLCMAMLMPVWMLYDAFRKTKKRADATAERDDSLRAEEESPSSDKQRLDDADARRRRENERRRESERHESERRESERENEHRESPRHPPSERVATRPQSSGIHPVLGLMLLLAAVVGSALAFGTRQTTRERSSSESVPTESVIAPTVAEPVQIRSEPAGADVLVAGDILLGVTPLDVPRPTGGQVATLTIRLRGYREEVVGITEFSPRTLSRTLVRLGSRRSQRGR